MLLIQLEKFSYLIGGIYNPVYYNMNTFFRKLDKNLEILNENEKKCWTLIFAV